MQRPEALDSCEPPQTFLSILAAMVSGWISRMCEEVKARENSATLWPA